FTADMEPAPGLSDGVCLKRRTGEHFVFYREDTKTIRLALSSMRGAQPAIAVDTRRVFQPIDLRKLSPGEQTWTAPHKSDWAIAVGDFEIPTKRRVPGLQPAR
ncbi:MAG: hypothetical protein QF805_31900, partial [Pirellulaceae bacterium]|nr:hypothetical protein [Pirellulaceae bacterium]